VRFYENYPDIPRLIGALDIAVQPWLSESFSNVLIEYMAASKPIVATPVGDAERVIKSGWNGILVEPGDPQELAEALMCLSKERGLASVLGRRAVEDVVKNWSLENMVHWHEQIFEKLHQVRNTSFRNQCTVTLKKIISMLR